MQVRCPGQSHASPPRGGRSGDREEIACDEQALHQAARATGMASRAQRIRPIPVPAVGSPRGNGSVTLFLKCATISRGIRAPAAESGGPGAATRSKCGTTPALRREFAAPRQTWAPSHCRQCLPNRHIRLDRRSFCPCRKYKVDSGRPRWILAMSPGRMRQIDFLGNVLNTLL